MAELLIIIGVSAIIVTTLGLMNEASHRGHSPVFFLVPVASLGQVQGNWEGYRWWALGRVAAVLVTAVGIAMYVTDSSDIRGPGSQLTHQTGQVQRGEKMATTTSFVTSEEAALLLVKGQGKPLSGRLHGESFRYDRVALIDGVLTVSQGEDFLPGLEVRVLVGWKPSEITERRSVLVNPSDDNAPVVHLSWKEPGQDFPETRIFEGGYRMELAMAPLDTGQLSGSLSLVMPDSFKSYLSGEFTAYTNHLRYVGGQVDLHFDHEDTLAYVARQYFTTQFPEGALKSIKTRHVILRRAESTGEVTSRVTLTNGAVEERVVRLEKSDVGWSVEPGSMNTQVITPPREGSMELVTPGAQPRQEAPKEVLPPVVQTFPELVAYVDQSVVLETHSGRQHDGVLRRVSAKRLWLEINVGSGVVERSIPEEELASLTLNTGQKILLQEPEPADLESGPMATQGSPNSADLTGAADSPEVEIAPAESSGNLTSPPVVVDDEQTRQYRELIGKNVTITADEGPARTGILQAVDQDHLTLSVPMGAGNIEFFYDLNSIRSIEAAR